MVFIMYNVSFLCAVLPTDPLRWSGDYMCVRIISTNRAIPLEWLFVLITN